MLPTAAKEGRRPAKEGKQRPARAAVLAAPQRPQCPPREPGERDGSLAQRLLAVRVALGAQEGERVGAVAQRAVVAEPVEGAARWRVPGDRLGLGARAQRDRA